MLSTEHPLVVLVGPTGSGKTDLSLALAAHFQAEIVSCDSVAVYRGFEIGTAKPSVTERARIPHHLIDVATPNETFTAGEYARQARAALAEIKSRGRLPIVVSGTGLYLRALIDGLFPGSQRSEQLRQRLRRHATAKPAGYLHRVLARLDAEAATRIHPNDTPKLIRAIEVCLSGGERISEMFRRGRDPLTGFRPIQLGLDPERGLLYERINNRCRKMFECGLVEETRVLLEQFASGDAAQVPSHPIHAPGYRQAAQHLRGEISLEEATLATQQAHRNYAKRQLTWYRNVSGAATTWLHGFGDEAAIQSAAVSLVSATFDSPDRFAHS
jgi:tRNA dimethylallyltransferase